MVFADTFLPNVFTMHLSFMDSSIHWWKHCHKSELWLFYGEVRKDKFKYVFSGRDSALCFAHHSAESRDWGEG